MSNTKKHGLYPRLCRYAGRILLFTEGLPQTRQGRHVEDQLLRSGTAAGANYSEAQGAQSPADFIHKVCLALKEARESLFWLHCAQEAEMGGPDLAWLVNEGDQLVAMLQAAKGTAQRNRDEGATT